MNMNLDLFFKPRRISAVSVAERIAKERNEKIGDNIGYRIRLKSKPPKGNGSILFTTPGMLLRNRFTNPDFQGFLKIYLLFFILFYYVIYFEKFY